ncbi:MAG: ACP phosphodiesterase [Prochloraceae cyanobacterium]|nr:ACP phosphodiesterase [Prochloraceae cyanobacterium]
MNWLAHLFLSEPTIEDRFGNLLADLVKGTNRQKLSPRFNKGIKCHLLIDSFTDRHLIVKRSKNRIDTDYKRYSGVLVDIIYDRILARNWQRYSQVSLSEFTEEIYTSFKDNLDDIPMPTRKNIERMIDEKLLDSYYYMSGVEKALIRIKQRLSSKHSNLFIVSNAMKQLENNYEGLEEDFNIFFPEIIDYLKTQKY